MQLKISRIQVKCHYIKQEVEDNLKNFKKSISFRIQIKFLFKYKGQKLLGKEVRIQDSVEIIIQEVQAQVNQLNGLHKMMEPT